MKVWEYGSEAWDYKTLSSPEFRPLSPEEERELILKAKRGDKAARDRVIKSNVRFVVAKAKMLSRDSGVPVEDLISEGILALYDAFENFNPQKNVRFLSYAKPYIDKAMYRYLKSYKVLSHMPTVSRKDMVKIVTLYQKLGREPSE
ncbi:MAG: sigma-70 family RNA polymerase sigma factor, partial [candidate division WOR-3 bacterium]